MRKASRDARLGHAQKCRGRLLKRLGLPAPPTGGSPAPQRRARAPSVTENVRDDEPDDAGSARCVVCREGFASRPRDALGAYVFSKLAAADVGGADGFQLVEGAVAVGRGARPPPAVASSVGAMHCIHANCHRDATRAERSLRSPRAEWDGAALRNSRVLCNSILPVRPPQNIEDWASAQAAYHAAVERHFGRVAQLGVAPAPASQLAAASATMSYASPSARALRSSRFQLAAHDARLLLLRLAHNEPLHQESGGGSRRSNLELCLYLLQLAGHQLQDRELGGAADPAIAQRERRHLDTVITASLDRTQGSADNRAKAAEAAPHAALLTLFATSNNRWSAERKRRTCARALKRSVDRAKSRAAASAAARGRRRAGSVSHGNPSPPGSLPLMPVVTAAGAPAPAAAAAELEAATAARAVTYARAALAFVALIDKLHGALETPLMPSENLIPPTDCTSLFSGDDASIARCATALASFYDSQLRDVENPSDVLHVMDLDADALELNAETRSMVFGS
jgi:E3 ubiquitin-protein ligase UBR4